MSVTSIMRLEHGFTIGTLAHNLRRFKALHLVATWFRRRFVQGLKEALLEMLRWMFADCERFGPPLYNFSIYQALRTGYPKLKGRILIHDQGNPVVKADGLLAIGGYCQHEEQPWPIFWSEHPRARLTGESLAIMDAKRVCLESVYGFKRLRDDPAYRFLRLPRPIKLEGTWTSIISRWVPTTGNPNYTHWLLDALPRLGLLSEFPEDTKILVPSRLFPSQTQSLELLGLLNRCRSTSERHLEVERFFFSGPTTMLEGYNPYGVNYLRTALLPKKDPQYSGPKKFYIKRTGYARDLSNAAEVEDFFRGIGWGIIQPADLSFAQQIKLFAEAEAICGTIGSGFTNAVFCQAGCKWILLAQDFMLDGWLEWISQVVKSEFRFLICHTGYTHKIDIDLVRLRVIFEELGLLH